MKLDYATLDQCYLGKCEGVAVQQHVNSTQLCEKWFQK